MKRTLVTGASGFVGANLARRLLHDGHHVHLLLRDADSSWRLKHVLPHCVVTPGSVSDPESVRHAVADAQPDWVFHLAAYGAYSNQTGFPQMVATNVLGLANLLDASISAGAEAFVHTGSSSEYGYQYSPARESFPIEPNSHYAIAKAAATHYCQFTAKKHDFRASTARLYSIYGPYEEPTRLIPTLLLHCLAGKLPPLVSPETARDFVYVDDAVDALIRIADSPNIPPGAVYNVASGTQTTISEIVSESRRLLSVQAEPVWGGMANRAWDTSVWCGDASLIERDLGWTASTTLADGLSATVQWLAGDPQLGNLYRDAIFKTP